MALKKKQIKALRLLKNNFSRVTKEGSDIRELITILMGGPWLISRDKINFKEGRMLIHPDLVDQRIRKELRYFDERVIVSSIISLFKEVLGEIS